MGSPLPSGEGEERKNMEFLEVLGYEDLVKLCLFLIHSLDKSKEPKITEWRAE